MTFLRNTKKGFTLVELLVVIAIIGILASIITVSLQSSRAKGRDGKRVADIRTLQLGLESYFNDNGYYPISLDSLKPNYISSIPKDPSNNSSYYLYTPYNSVPSANCVGTNKAIKYHLAAIMESDDSSNPALKQDVDWAYANGSPTTYCNTGTNVAADFNGNAASCSGNTAALADNCYDQTN